MHVVLAALAEAANVSQEGNLNILGIFDTLPCTDLPHRHPKMVLAFRMRGEYGDSARSLSVKLVDEDGRQRWGAVVEVTPPRLAPGVFSHLDQIIAFKDLVFPRAGRYTFRIMLDGEGEIPHDVVFQVVQETGDSE